MKTLLKILIGIIVLIVLLVGALRIVHVVTGTTIAGRTISRVTGNAEVGGLVDKVINGEDLTDEEIMEATGVDEETYEQAKEHAKELGIDVNDSEQLKNIVKENADNADEIRDIVEKVKSGEMSEEEAQKAVEGLIVIPEE